MPPWLGRQREEADNDKGRETRIMVQSQRRTLCAPSSICQAMGFQHLVLFCGLLPP